jgi:hypothetical protein
MVRCADPSWLDQDTGAIRLVLGQCISALFTIEFSEEPHLLLTDIIGGGLKSHKRPLPHGWLI